MIAQARGSALIEKNADHAALPYTSLPPQMASNSRITPSTVASMTLPARQKRKYPPMSMAMGIVAPTVNTPHGLSASALATTNPSTASKMVRMARIATKATIPAGPLNSSLTIVPSDFPFRRMEKNRMVKSCTAPPSTTPMRIQSKPGR